MNQSDPATTMRTTNSRPGFDRAVMSPALDLPFRALPTTNALTSTLRTMSCGPRLTPAATGPLCGSRIEQDRPRIMRLLVGNSFNGDMLRIRFQDAAAIRKKEPAMMQTDRS